MNESMDKPKKRIKGKTAAVILVILLVYLAAAALAAAVIDGRHVRFYMTAPENMKLECFDIQSTKEKQFGFRAELPSSDDDASENHAKPLVLACLGDEPYNEQNRRYIEGADWMMCEAFCLYADRDTFKPYEKCHSTALDAGKLAEELGVKNLILYHTEEKTLATRKENYTREAAENFKGRIFVPDDLEVIEL